ncbi:MAG: 1,4-alpha-glucan branching protein GlgB [Ruminococcaceae bacterium]|nr:1,4-alpha-glucan branching protein GlgB [Oscillospiraceae bacterium]
MHQEERSALLSKHASGYMTDAYQLLGAHDEGDGITSFRVWAPNARAVSVVGDFNGWDPSQGTMFHIGNGVWEGIHTGVSLFDCYKYRITCSDGTEIEKSDPYATHTATRPDTASKVFPIDGFAWTDSEYLAEREKKDHFSSPINIYEIHLGSWRRHGDGSFLSYRELADELIPYLLGMHYTHVELLPITEHPYDPSWGYQVTGYYAPTSRYGTPHDFMYFINKCHENGIGVILDWVGAHFPKDACGLATFDGSFCYESPDPVMNEHPDWGTRIFNYSRNEVRVFLISSVCFWLKEYHVDGIRADAVASMLYLDYGRAGREWHPNRFGGNHNLDAIEFLKAMNHAAFSVCPSALMIAEESTAFPGVTKPSYAGGLGFNFKWNMGWMHDTLNYMSTDPLFRKHHHGTLLFPFHYALTENYVLPLSHDEVVHLKGSMIGKMSGEYDQKFANLRALYAYMFAFPGKKMNFMGNDFAQFAEWNENRELDWFLKSYEKHNGISALFSALGKLYLETPALYELDTSPDGFSLTVADDSDQSVVVFRRMARSGDEVIVACNFCPVKREEYRIGVSRRGKLIPIFSSEDVRFGGSGTPLKAVSAVNTPSHGLPCSATLTLPPLSVTFYSLHKTQRRKNACYAKAKNASPYCSQEDKEADSWY